MTSIEAIASALTTHGHCRVRGADMRQMLGERRLAGWTTFAASWSDLEIDGFMADRGRYRRRRFACFAADLAHVVVREPHQPHFQSRQYNALNGGVNRWFAPVTDAIADHDITRSLVGVCIDAFTRAERPASAPRAWRVEMHQFRIETQGRDAGLPTPEGMHRDGVDWVLVLLVGRSNVEGGTTTISNDAGQALGAFTLEDPLDAVFLHDRRVWHGVTPIVPQRPDQPAHRDALVLTFRGVAPAVRAVDDERATVSRRLG